MGKKRKDEDVSAEGMFAPEGAAPAAAPRALSPRDIQEREFRTARFGGYKMREVDEFLDQLTDAFSALQAENEQLRARGGGGSVLGVPDLDDVSRQADEIIQRARTEASRILDSARTEAAGVAGAGATAGSTAALSAADRAAVGAFLNRERGFLQDLAGLVQQHAEAVKGMAREARSAPAPAPAPGSQGPAASPPETPRPAAPATPPSAPPSASPRPRQPVRTEQAQPPARPSEQAPPAKPPADEGDESLRELFWGED